MASTVAADLVQVPVPVTARRALGAAAGPLASAARSAHTGQGAGWVWIRHMFRRLGGVGVIAELAAAGVGWRSWSRRRRTAAGLRTGPDSGAW